MGLELLPKKNVVSRIPKPGIANDGVIDSAQMTPKLMAPPRQRVGTHQAVTRFWVSAHRDRHRRNRQWHHDSLCGLGLLGFVMDNGSIDLLRLEEMPADQRQIALFHLTAFKNTA